MKGIARLAWMAGMIALLSACGGTDRHSATRDGADWPTTGGTLDAQRFSPLNSINRDTVGRLGLAWSVDLDTNAGQEATPIMRDGTLYIISAYDVVRAVDARTGEVRWTYDPQVRAAAARSCCGPVSRGVAVENGLVYVGALDGRLIALNAQDGTVRWQVQTLDDAWPPAVNYSITGAPRVIKGRVIIGNGGAEFGARGFITAYDAQSGKKEWRFYTVPGKPGTRDNAASDAMLGKDVFTRDLRQRPRTCLKIISWNTLEGYGLAIDPDPQNSFLFTYHLPAIGAAHNNDNVTDAFRRAEQKQPSSGKAGGDFDVIARQIGDQGCRGHHCSRLCQDQRKQGNKKGCLQGDAHQCPPETANE